MTSKILLAGMALAYGCTAQAQSQEPGLWETTFHSSAAAQADMLRQRQMASLPAAQRAQIEKMMGSAGLGAMSSGTTMTVCISKADAARPGDVPLPAGCTRTDTHTSGNVLHYGYRCRQPEPVSVEGDIEFLGMKAYRGKSSVTTTVDGQPRTDSSEISGKWLSADCGDIQPRSTRAR